MEEAYSNARTKTLIVKLIDIRILLEQWMKLIENVTLHQMEEVTESLNTKEAAAFLSTSSLETEMSNNEEIRLDAIETATESFNYTSDESQTSLEQQSINLSGLYDMIKKQEEAIQKLLLSIAKSKDLEAQITHLKNELLREKRLQKATVEQNKLCKQLENVEYDLQLQKNELNISIQEKLKEQQGLPLKNENLKSRLQTIEKDNYDIAKSATLLENKLFEQNKLQKQIENIEHEFLAQKCKLKFAHVEEKKKLVEEQQRLLSEFVSLQSR